jgi:hypothetical protein
MKSVRSGLCLLTATGEVTGEKWIEEDFFRICKSILGIDDCNKILRKTFY